VGVGEERLGELGIGGEIEFTAGILSGEVIQEL